MSRCKISRSLDATDESLSWSRFTSGEAWSDTSSCRICCRMRRCESAAEGHVIDSRKCRLQRNFSTKGFYVDISDRNQYGR